MSEFEILKRQEYKRNRKKWLFVQIVAVVVLAAVALSSFWTYHRMNRTYYVSYTEDGSIDYQVHYGENDFFDREWLGKDQSYISSLIDGVNAELAYQMKVGSSDMRLAYRYEITQQLLVASKDNGTPYYTREETLLPLTEVAGKDASAVKIRESVQIDYQQYDDWARNFVKTYDLKNASCTLIVTLQVDVSGTNKLLSKDDRSSYTTALHIPLAADTFSIHTTASATGGESRVFEYQDSANKELFLVLGVVAAALTGLTALTTVVYLHLTRNEDITYEAKVRKILRAYGSFIQRMNGEFDCSGYQVVEIRSFTEMLGIRDTIQSPVLMSENRDETMTRFFIPTESRLLYAFDIKVDNYDEIYGREETPAEVL